MKIPPSSLGLESCPVTPSVRNIDGLSNLQIAVMPFPFSAQHPAGVTLVFPRCRGNQARRWLAEPGASIAVGLAACPFRARVGAFLFQ